MTEYLQSPPYNPVPGSPKSGMIEVEVGIFLRFALWRSPASTGKGTILMLQGRSEYIEKNYGMVRELVSRGYDVLAFDWRGQGGSSRLLEKSEPGYIDSFQDYVDDLLAVIAQIGLPDCRSPLQVLGHSMGSLVALLAAPRLGNKLDRMVLCSPLLGMQNQRLSEGAIRYLSGVLSAFGMGEIYLSGNQATAYRAVFEDNRLTSDEARFRRNDRFAKEFPNLCIGGATASWVYAMCKAFETVREPDFVRSISLPVLIINAGNDQVVDNRAAERFARGLRIGRVLEITGARHEIWQEQDFYREQMLSAFSAFVPGSAVTAKSA